MHKFKMKSKHPINKSTNRIKDPLPTFGEWTPPLATHHPPPVAFPVNKKKKKKIDPATGGGRDPHQRPGGEIRPPSVARFVSPMKQKKKKRKKRDKSGHWGWS
jgi:hypothetical protein